MEQKHSGIDTVLQFSLITFPNYNLYLHNGWNAFFSPSSIPFCQNLSVAFFALAQLERSINTTLKISLSIAQQPSSNLQPNTYPRSVLR